MRLRVTFTLTARQRRAIAMALDHDGLASYEDSWRYLESLGMMGVEQAEADYSAELAAEYPEL